MRVAVVERSGIGQLHFLEQFHHPLARLGLVQLQVQADRFGHLLAHGVHGVQRRHGFLEHHGQVVATVTAHAVLIKGQQIHRSGIAAQQGLANGARMAHVQQAHQRKGGHTFPTSACAHEPKAFAAAQCEGDGVDDNAVAEAHR